jgi:hypothetical protein
MAAVPSPLTDLVKAVLAKLPTAQMAAPEIDHAFKIALIISCLS